MKIVDQEQLMEHLEGDLEMLEDTFEMFCEECETAQTELRYAVEASDIKTAHSVSHLLKGMLANFFAQPACETLTQIEMIESQESLVNAKPLLNKLDSQIKIVITEIEQILKSNAK